MRRKSERTASKKGKASPEKKVEKVKRTRSKRTKKQSTSSENESADEGSPARETVEKVMETEVKPPSTPTKDASSEEAQDQVWQVKTAETSGDVGEIQKLKICLTRPPTTPERADRSPRSKRKHSRATSSSDTPSVEVSDEKKSKSKHRSRRSTRESKDEGEKNDSQSEDPETESQSKNISQKSSSEITQSTDVQSKEAQPDETPMSTTCEDEKPDSGTDASKDNEVPEKPEEADEKNENEAKNAPSDADTTVDSAKDESQDSSYERKVSSNSESPVRHRSESVDKSEVLEIHAEDSKLESLEVSKVDEAETVGENLIIPEAKVQSSDIQEGEVSISGDKRTSEGADVVKASNDNDVVEKSEGNEMGRIRETSVLNKDKEMDQDKNDDIENSTPKVQEETNIEQSTPFVVSRKRRWGARPKLTSQKSITISTDILKEIIPDVKPAEFDEVIEEKKHKRIEIPENKVERPVLPKIVIDNSENVEQHKKEIEEKNHVVKIESLGANRKISIVKENSSILTRPPSPPRHKQSNILYITNLVRPFTLPQLKNLLQRTGRIAENGFWIDRIKSKCFVKYETEDQAVETRHALHGVTWPVSNPKTLQVDFSTQDAFDYAKKAEENDNGQVSTLPGTVEDWLREQDMKREKGELEKPLERKTMREWDMGKNEKEKEKDNINRFRRDDKSMDRRRHRSPDRSPEPAKKFKKKEEEAPAKLLDDLFRKTKTTPCIYWLPLSAETIAIKEEQRRQHMAEHERRMQELRRTHPHPHRRH